MSTGIYKRKPMSEETKRRISLSNMGKVVSEETKRKLREINLGKKYSQEVNLKKGLKGSKNPFYGKKHTEETLIIVREKRAKQNFSLETCEKKRMSMIGKNKNEKHWAWKGDDVGYLGLHHWVERNLGQPDTCEHCGKTGLTGHKIHWANKNHTYKRNLADWMRLCSSCHKKYDLKYNSLHKK